MGLKILSCFDGISCGQQALKRIGKHYDMYYASEIHQPSIDVTQYRFPNTIQVGDIKNIDAEKFKDVNVIIGGSPCQGFSMAGKRKGMVTVEHLEITTLEQYMELKNDGFQFDGQSYLFWEFIRLIKEIKPKYFFLENVRTKKKWMDIISESIGVEPIRFNSSLVSAQFRERYYWTNIPIKPVVDKQILLKHIIPGAVGCGYRGRRNRQNPFDKKYYKIFTVNKKGKANCIVTNSGNTNLYMVDGEVHKMTPEHAERLQTIDVGYTNISGISNSNRYKMIGNAWTVDVITEFFKNLI